MQSVIGKQKHLTGTPLRTSLRRCAEAKTTVLRRFADQHKSLLRLVRAIASVRERQDGHQSLTVALLVVRQSTKCKVALVFALDRNRRQSNVL
jgi:hypothetical protein